MNQPLWNYEDMTAKVWWVRSAEQLTILLRHVLRVFRDSLPHALVSQRWAQTALQLGLSCSSRHYAGRSLQVFRALRVPITSRMLSDILSRLVETVAEQGEDMQVIVLTPFIFIIIYHIVIFFKGICDRVTSNSRSCGRFFGIGFQTFRFYERNFQINTKFE